MYYIKTIEDKVRIPPALFGSSLHDAFLHILREKFEGRVLKDIGMVLAVDNPKPLGRGIIIPGDGGAYYEVSFDSLTFIPRINEVYFGDVKEVVEFGAFVSIGPLQGLLHLSQISKEKFSYDKKAKLLSCKIERRSIKKLDRLLVKISTISMKSAATAKLGLTMRPDGLGKIEWLEEEDKKKKEVKKTKEKEESEEKK